MLFSSTVFIFCFLPLTILTYFATPRKYLEVRNGVLLIFSIGFYAWGEPKFVLIMLFSILGNYFVGLCIDKRKHAKLFLEIGIAFNISIIFIFKYLNFAIANINELLSHVFLENEMVRVPQTEISLPIGISFFTFQAISYIIDVYRKKVDVQKNPFYLGLYISFFPQLIAGPIVRYTDINVAIIERKESWEKFNVGVKRFIFGLAKKVILSNNMALIADRAFADAADNRITTMLAWLGIVAYTLQIFFDFSGYSDMAIGLGKIFGFDFNENFNYPYISKSVSEFWRRWHISLGSWFRDYVYFPLGGSRVKTRSRLIFNLFVVWLLTGIWHGASWNFIVWGLLYFVLITFEKISGYPEKLKTKIVKFLYRVFTLISVMFGWVIFRAEGMRNAGKYLFALVGIGVNGFIDNVFIQFFMENVILLVFSILLATPLVDEVLRRIKLKDTVLGDIYTSVICMLLLIVCSSYLVLESYNPFIYFNF